MRDIQARWSVGNDATVSVDRLFDDPIAGRNVVETRAVRIEGECRVRVVVRTIRREFVDISAPVPIRITGIVGTLVHGRRRARGWTSLWNCRPSLESCPHQVDDSIRARYSAQP